MTIQLPGSERVVARQGGGRSTVTPVLAGLVVTTKVLLLVCVVRVVADPAWANLEGKAPYARAIMYPLWAFAVPALWVLTRRRAPDFPWLADLLVTLTCFTDVVGNRLDLYDSITWFDDGMHVMNTALVSAAFVLLVLPRSASSGEIAAVAVAVGMSASLAWELFEYGTFLTRSTEWTTAYSDTIGDLGLGWLGSVLAALLLTAVWRPRPVDR